MKKLIIAIIIFGISFPLLAQENEEEKVSKKEIKKLKVNMLARQEEEGVINYRKHFLAGAKLTTDGYGAFLEKGISKSVNKSLLFQLEITERKHRKEQKSFDPSVGDREPFIYGKINYFYPVKLGVQQQFLLGNKTNKNGVSVTGNVGGGISLALLRPYLILVEKNGSDQRIGYEGADSTRFLSSSVLAAPTLGTGWNKLKVTPGFYLKPALRFDYGKFNEMITALEIGVIAEYYTKNIPQMALNDYKKFFFSGYVSILFGKRK